MSAMALERTIPKTMLAMEEPPTRTVDQRICA
jgi:hypothetical protein